MEIEKMMNYIIPIVSAFIASLGTYLATVRKERTTWEINISARLQSEVDRLQKEVDAQQLRNERLTDKLSEYSDELLKLKQYNYVLYESLVKAGLNPPAVDGLIED